MAFETKNREELIEEITALRRQVAELESELTQSAKLPDLEMAIIDNMLEGVQMTRTTDGVIVYANPRFKMMVGYGHGELIGQPVAILNAPGDKTPEEFTNEIVAAVEQHGIWRGEVHNIRKDGTLFWCRAGIARYYHPLHGSVLVSINVDITEQKSAEAALQESQNFVQKILDAAPNFIYIDDLVEKRNVYSNRDMVEFLGYTHKPGQPLEAELMQTILHPDDAARLAEHRASFVTAGDGEVREIEYRLKHASGEWLWLRTREVVFLRSQSGKVQQILGVAEDITARKQALEQLRQSEEALKIAQRVSHVGSWKWHIQTNQLEWSEEMYHIFGIDRDTFSGGLGEVIARAIHPEDRPAVEASNLSVMNEKKPIPVEYRVIWADQSIHVVWGEAGELVLDEAGNPDFLTGIVQDITERKRLQAQMLENEKLASLGTLAAGIAHEMNSPLQIITGISDRLKRDLVKNLPVGEKLPADVDAINRHAWRIARIVRSLLAYAHSSTNQQYETHNLNEVITDTLLLIEHQLLSWSNITIEKQLAPDLPPLYCDKNDITQMLINLITNAADAMPAGGWITLRTAFNPESRRFMLQVCDTGSGIPESVKARVFDPFFTTKEVGKGTGLGLSIVSGIVQSHGGEIEMSSDSKGTTFTIYLPQEPPPASTLEETNEQAGRYKSP